jgi:MFS family permease
VTAGASPESRPRERLLTQTFILLSASHFLHALSYHLFLHLPGFLAGLGARELDIGVLSGLASLAAILGRPPLGRVMDVRGRRPVVWAGGVLGALSCAAYLLVRDLGPLVYVVRIAHGVSEAMLFASLFAFAADIVPASRRIEGIGLFGVSGMLPMAIAGALGDAILSRASYSALFWTGAAASVVALALSLPLSEPHRDRGEPPRGLWSAVVDRSLLPLWIGGLCFAVALAAHFNFLKTFVITHPIARLGDFFTTYAVAAVFIRVAFGSLPERLGPKRVLTAALLLLASGLVTLAFASARSHVVLAGLLAGIGHGYAFPILLGLVITRARPTERGGALALYTALFDGGTLIGGPLLGAIIEAASYRTMFLSAAMLLLAGLAILTVGDRRSTPAHSA